MKKVFLSALIIAGTTASFAQAQNTKTVTRMTTATSGPHAAAMNPQMTQTNAKVSKSAATKTTSTATKTKKTTKTTKTTQATAK